MLGTFCYFRVFQPMLGIFTPKTAKPDDRRFQGLETHAGHFLLFQEVSGFSSPCWAFSDILYPLRRF
jgi:hypothetical protein